MGERRCSEDRFKPKKSFGKMTPLLGNWDDSTNKLEENIDTLH